MDARWEFVEKKASNKVRELYVEKILERKKSYRDPFVLVGYDEPNNTKNKLGTLFSVQT